MHHTGCQGKHRSTVAAGLDEWLGAYIFAAFSFTSDVTLGATANGFCISESCSLRKVEFKFQRPRPVYPAATVHPDPRRCLNQRRTSHRRGYTRKAAPVSQDHFDEVVVGLCEVVGQRCAGFDLIPVRT